MMLRELFTVAGYELVDSLGSHALAITKRLDLYRLSRQYATEFYFGDVISCERPAPSWVNACWHHGDVY